MSDVLNFISVGGRSYLFSDGQKEIYSDGEWSLHQYNSRNPDEQWTNYKLYRNAKAKKRVWYMGVHQDAGLHTNADVEKLNKYHPGMLEWALAAMDGVVMPLPEPLEPVVAVNGYVTKEMVEKAVQRLRRAWDEGNPLSPYGQTKSTGRYAADKLAKELGIKVGLAENLIEGLIKDGVISVEMISTKTKMKGLKVRDE